jgi:hypothetical protein
MVLLVLLVQLQLMDVAEELEGHGYGAESLWSLC